MLEVMVARQHRKLMTDTETGKQRIDGSDLHAAATAVISQVGGLNVVVSVGHQQRHCGESTHDLRKLPRPVKALQKLLKNQAGRDDRLAVFDCAHECLCLWRGRRRITPEREGPDARVDEEGQSRWRSRL
jgi:hypothetical protein